MQSSILAEQKQIDAFDNREKLLKNEKKNHQQSLLQISQLKNNYSLIMVCRSGMIALFRST